MDEDSFKQGKEMQKYRGLRQLLMAGFSGFMPQGTNTAESL